MKKNLRIEAGLQYNILRTYLSGRYPAFSISNTNGWSSMRDKVVAIGEVTGINVDLKELEDNIITVTLIPTDRLE